MHFHFISQNQSIVGQGTGTSNTVLQVYFQIIFGDEPKPVQGIMILNDPKLCNVLYIFRLSVKHKKCYIRYR
jgi:hypothetical protein